MTLFEKAYITTRERDLWNELLELQKELGIDNPITNRQRTRWNEVYTLCQHFFPEYRVNVTPAD